MTTKYIVRPLTELHIDGAALGVTHAVYEVSDADLSHLIALCPDEILAMLIASLIQARYDAAAQIEDDADADMSDDDDFGELRRSNSMARFHLDTMAPHE